MPRYKFIAGCPACGSCGLWHHKNCSSYGEIDEDGWIYCNGCNKYLGFIMDLEFNCGCNDCKSEKKDVKAVLQALAMMANAQKDVPREFFEHIILKIMERLRNK